MSEWTAQAQSRKSGGRWKPSSLASDRNVRRTSSDAKKSQTVFPWMNRFLIVRIIATPLLPTQSTKKAPIVMTGATHHITTYHSSFGTLLHSSRLSCGQRACPSRTLYRHYLIFEATASPNFDTYYRLPEPKKQ